MVNFDIARFVLTIKMQNNVVCLSVRNVKKSLVSLTLQNT